MFVTNIKANNALANIDHCVGNAGNGASLVSITIRPASSPIVTRTLTNRRVGPNPRGVRNVNTNFVPTGLSLGLISGIVNVAGRRTVSATHHLVRRRNVLTNVSSKTTITTTLGLRRSRDFAGGGVIIVLPSSNRHCLDATLFTSLFARGRLRRWYRLIGGTWGDAFLNTFL